MDQNEGDEVALKIVNPSSGTPLGPWAEAQILRRLSDNHILPIRNAFAHLGVAMIVTEVAHHGTVEGRINAEPLGLDVAEAVRWTRHACQGLTRAHDLGLVHNDIKPGNLFLTERNDCLVGDFGYAGRIDPATGTAPVYGGTVQTIAPEIAAKWGPSAIANRASDVYSIAATAYWMLAGEPPHRFRAGMTLSEMMLYVATTRPRPLRGVAPHIPGPIARVVDGALAVDPSRRPGTPQQLGADLGRRISGRRWRRTDEHAAHLACWRGVPPGSGSTYLLCMTQGPHSVQRLLQTRHAGSGRAVGAGNSTATRTSWPAAVRRLMRDLD